MHLGEGHLMNNVREVKIKVITLRVFSYARQPRRSARVPRPALNGEILIITSGRQVAPHFAVISFASFRVGLRRLGIAWFHWICGPFSRR